MKVLVVTNLYPPQELGGYGRSLADFSWALMKRGHTVKILCSNAEYLGPGGRGPSNETVYRELRLKGTFKDGVKIEEDKLVRMQVDRHNSLLIGRLLANETYDAVLVGNIDLLGPEIIFELLRYGCNVFHHIGFIAPPYTPDLVPTTRRYSIVGASRAVVSSMRASGISTEREAVVMPGVRLETMQVNYTDRQLISGYGSLVNPARVCFAGLLMGSKGLHTLIEATARLMKQGVAIDLAIAGKEYHPGYKRELQEFCKKTGINQNVTWYGELDRRKLSRFYSLNEIGVFPSIYSEAFGIVGAEMMASRLALVSSGVGGSKELFEDGTSGIRFEAGNSIDLSDKLYMIIRDKRLMTSLRNGSFTHAKTFLGIESSAAQLEQLLMR